MRYLRRIPIIIYICTWSHTMNNVILLVSDISNIHGRPIAQLINSTHLGEYIPFYLIFIPGHTFVSPKSIISGLVDGRPINAGRDIFLQWTHQWNISQPPLKIQFIFPVTRGLNPHQLIISINVSLTKPFRLNTPLRITLNTQHIIMIITRSSVGLTRLL